MSQAVASTIEHPVYDEVFREGNLDIADELIALGAIDREDVGLSSLRPALLV